MRRFDVCNGDADGLCAVLQWRLAMPQPATLVTGLKRQIDLLQQVPARAGDEVLVCDLSMQRNHAALLRLLQLGVQVRYFDHHKVDHIPQHPALQACIDFDPQVCTSLLMDRQLGGRFRAWALVGAYGDNLTRVADELAAGMGLGEVECRHLRLLGEGINYNAYGDEASDQHISPERLYARLSRHAQPLDLLRQDSIGSELDALRRADLQQALAQDIHAAGGGARWVRLPDAAWSRRVIGGLANELASRVPQQAHAVLKADRLGGYVVSLRAPQNAPSAADEFCRRFGGGGRAGAAGIDHLPAAELQRFVAELAAMRWGEPPLAPTAEAGSAPTRMQASHGAGKTTGLSLAGQRDAVAALRQALGAQLIETHISFVLLAHGLAYKIKKAVDLGFLDFTTLAQRQFFAGEELRLNRRTAPDLYLDVQPLTGSATQPRLGGDGEPIDWVLRMRAFAQDGLWDRLASSGGLQPVHIDAGVEALCALHRDAAVAAPDDPVGQAAQVRAPLRDSLAALQGLCRTPDERARLEALDTWEQRAFDTLRGHFDQRQRDGHVRECHGDLHLGNVTQFEGRTTLFDCLEFSAALRWTDVMSDVAFLAMDLKSHGLGRLSHRFVNGYVERSGDVAGLRVLRYYQVHRALVRAKVAALRGAQLPAGEPQRTQAGRTLDHYLDVALEHSRPSPPVLMLTHGLSGSGKTLLTQSLLELCAAIRLRADVERKRLFGLDALARSDASLRATLYSATATQATQARLREMAALALQAGYSVILDATFLARSQRQLARALAQGLGVGFVLLDFQASEHSLRERVRQRASQADDASEADLSVLQEQLLQAQPLDDDERAEAFEVNAEMAFDEAAMPARWAPLLRRVGITPA